MTPIKKNASYDEVMQAVAEGDRSAHELTAEYAESAASGAIDAADDAPKKRNRMLFLLGAMGPGIVSAMAGNDAGGISTYSTAGADFGYATLWSVPIMCLLLAVVQMTASRMGAVTGKGFAALIRERFGIRLTTLAMIALLIGNVATTFSEFAGIASGMEPFRRVEVHFGAYFGSHRVGAHCEGRVQKRRKDLFGGIACVRDLCGGGIFGGA